MIYLLYGEATGTREKLHVLVENLRSKKPDAFYFHIHNENADGVVLEELLYSQGLFEKKYIVVFDQLLAHEALGEELLGALEALKSSAHVFIFLEEKLDRKVLAKFEKHAEKIQEFKEREALEKEQFNLFSLTDALGARDSEKTWVLYQKAKFSGVTDEELFGMLSWQVRAMLRASQSENSNDAGLKPYPYRKAKSHAQNYSKTELTQLSSNLISLYHDARRGAYELEVALESLLLAL